MPSPDVQAAVDDLAEKLQRSVVVDDTQLGLLYSSVHFGDEDQVRVDTMLKRRADSRAVGHMLSSGILSWHRPGVVPGVPEIGLLPRLCAPVRWQGELIAFIVVMGDQTVSDEGVAEIVAVADRIAPILAEEFKGADDAAQQALLALVGADTAARRRAVAELGTAGAGRDQDLVTAIRLAVHNEGLGASDAHIAATLRSALALPKPTGIRAQLSAVDGREAVVVLRGGDPHADDLARVQAARMLARINELSAGHFQAVAGVGPSLAGLDRAHESSELASLAVRAATIGIGDEVSMWVDLGPYGPLLRIPDDHLTAELLPLALRRLLEVDRDGNLLTTLRVYLDSAASAPSAATTLHIHRTTLYYRLSRIEELLEVDLADGRTRLTLHLGLALMDLMPGSASAPGR